MTRRVRMRGGVRLHIPTGWSTFTYEGEQFEVIRILDDGTMLVRRV